MNTTKQLLSRMPGGEAEIRKRTVKDQVADKLAYMIQSGLLQIGDELPSERELSNTLQVARESVRGAIGVLAARGMIEVSQGARTRVMGTAGMSLVESVSALSRLRGRKPEEVNEARETVERQVVRLAAERISDSALARLSSLTQEQAAMLQDPVAFQISDREFHSVIYAACGNPLLENFVCDLYDFALDFRRLAMQQPGAIANSVRDHQAIVSALKKRSPKAVELAVGQHLDHIHHSTVRVMQPGADAGQPPSAD